MGVQHFMGTQADPPVTVTIALCHLTTSWLLAVLGQGTWDPWGISRDTDFSDKSEGLEGKKPHQTFMSPVLIRSTPATQVALFTVQPQSDARTSGDS